VRSLVILAGRDQKDRQHNREDKPTQNSTYSEGTSDRITLNPDLAKEPDYKEEGT
jgi:hypothetical protein